jgi:hypothetical protein
VFGLFDRRKRKEAAARKRELQGRLEDAVALFLEAELPAEAARVLLLRADAETTPEGRMTLCAQAARVGEGTAEGAAARRRKALLAFDLVQGSGGATLYAELARVAAELEACGEWQAAARAYVKAGDPEGEIRVLRDAGAIDQLEQRLEEASEAARRERDRARLLRSLRDQDAIGERRLALRSARAWLEREEDDNVRLELQRIGGRLLRGPTLVLTVGGRTTTYVLGREITIGRSQADVVVCSSSISRQHLRLYREGDEPHVEDLGTRNGTFVGGARIDRLPIGAGLSLSLAGEVPCHLSPVDPAEGSGVAVEIGGARYVASLGQLEIGGWQLSDAHEGDDRFVVLRTPHGREPPYLGAYRLGPQIELCHGDELRRGRSGPVVLAVPGPRAEPGSLL